ncbi:GNAT family protein [Streptomyces sp. NPDC003077]|uniref:GNAT family N-acetyltransferase n=1 Tax=Streptomyces sp. NPDC003077 TaxID=3154443 RepID=UPI0033BFB2C8
MYPVTKDSHRLTLRELVIDDVDALHAIYGSAEVTEHLSFTPRSRAEVGIVIARSITSATAPLREEYALAVIERSTGEFIGFTRLATDPHQQRAATIGFALRPDAWGVGYGAETVRLLLALAFTDLELHRVWAARSPLNTAAEKCLHSAGMTDEGRIRDHILKNGVWRESLTCSILREEWAAGRNDG